MKRAFAIITALAVLALSSAFTFAQTSPATPACRPYPEEPVVYFSGLPNLGGVTGGIQVTEGAQVQLQGVAEWRGVANDCSYIVTPITYFRWQLQFQPRSGGPAVNLSASMNLTDTLAPYFTPAERGTYTAQLITLYRTHTMIVEVIRAGLEWTQIGPDGTAIPGSSEIPATGRVNVMAFDPNEPATLYAGTQLGGVFKSTNRGAWWTPVSDHKGWPNLAVSALTVAGDGTIYAGVGGPRVNYAYNQPLGAGVMKSTDNGETWKRAGDTAAGCPLGSVGLTDLIYRIVADPFFSSHLYAAGQNGLYRSLDSGQCWTSINQFTYRSVTDITLKPGDANVLYVGVRRSGVFKSTSPWTSTPAFGMLTVPVTMTDGRILFAVTPAQPATLYASFTTGNSSSFLRYTGDGAAFTIGGTRSPQRCVNPRFSYCDYADALAVKPDDADRVFSSEVSAWQSLDGMQTWNTLHSYPIHDDVQGLFFPPDDPNMLYAATDGGVYRIALAPRNDLASQGPWQMRNQNLAVAAGATMGIAPSSRSKGATAMWDNGSKRRISGHIWKSFGDNDGFTVAMEQSSADTIYYMPSANAGADGLLNFARYHRTLTYTNGSWNETDDGTGDIGSVQPGYALYADPRRAGRVLGIDVADTGGTNQRFGGKLYATDNAHTATSASWVCADPLPGGAALYSLDFGLNGNYIAGFSNGQVYSFTLPASLPGPFNCNSGTAAQNVTLLYSEPSGRAIRIAVDPFDANALYGVVPRGYGSSRVIRLARSMNGTWVATLIAGGFSDPKPLPYGVNFGGQRRNNVAFAADPSMQGVLWLGTTLGLYMGEPISGTNYAWTLDPYVPETDVTEIVPHRITSGGFSGELQLVTYGRSVWRRVEPLSVFRYSPDLICLPCHMWSSEILPIPDPSQKLDLPPVYDRYALLTLPYDYDGSAGSTAILQATPLFKGKALTSFFQGGTGKVEKGSGAIFTELSFNADNLLAGEYGQFSDELLIELLPATVAGRSPAAVPITSTTVPFEKLWLAGDGRSLTVEALGQGASLFPLQVPLSIQIGADQPFSQTSYYQQAVAAGVEVVVEAPLDVKTEDGMADFSTWIVNGIPQNGGTTLKVTVSENTQLAALYELEEGGEYFPMPTTLFLPVVIRGGQ